MSLTHIKLEDFSNWREYYWAYQNTLAKEYYIPLLGEWDFQINGIKVLDIGCGNGGFTEAFGEAGASITGVEIKSFNWKGHPNVQYLVQDITADNAVEKLGVDFELIILRDVIEHIPLNEKLNFFKSALKFGSPDAKFLVTFPPFYSPFGIHQQTFLKTFLRKIPYLSWKPLWALKPLLKIIGENEEAISNIQEIHKCRMTLRRFELLVNKLNLGVVQEKSFLIRPSHEIRYGWKTREFKGQLFTGFRELVTLGVVYLLKK